MSTTANTKQNESECECGIGSCEARELNYLEPARGSVNVGESRDIGKEIERERERARARLYKIRRYLKQKKNRGSSKLSVKRGGRGFTALRGN